MLGKFDRMSKLCFAERVVDYSDFYVAIFILGFSISSAAFSRVRNGASIRWA